MADQLKVLVLGASGTAGQGAVRALVEAGHHAVAVVREGSKIDFGSGVDVRSVSRLTERRLSEEVVRGEAFDGVISCIASRTGVPEDAWAVDYVANVAALAAAEAAGIPRFVLVSAICVQTPVLEFQKAKLAFEADLAASSLAWSIVRPTAFFKSLSGQIDRVQADQSYMIFGDGCLTACKPISDDDLGRFLVRCLTDPALSNRILPIGGPGPAITPLDQAEAIFALTGKTPKYQKISPGFLQKVAAVLDLLGRVIPPLRAKAELARIGHFYATNSMLVINSETQRYDPDATPETGTETLFDHYARLIETGERDARGDHKVF